MSNKTKATEHGGLGSRREQQQESQEQVTMLVDLVNLAVQPFGSIFNFFILRNSISLLSAAVTNCPVLSPVSLTFSTAFITSCGTRAATVCDFAFTALVATFGTPSTNKKQYAGIKKSVQHLTCLILAFKLVFNTFVCSKVKMTKPRSATNTNGVSNPQR